ncbi:MAG: DNA polymerase I [Lachnospiraceae bacterium]|nr:DNA polymerase I [Lachnospiraceae bacterium]
MSEKLVLIDGNSIINRAFYGIPMLTNNEGIHTNAIYGFLNIMFKILEEEEPRYLAIAFDLKAPTFRHKMYDAYKGTRKPMPDELREQVPILKELLSKMQICTVEQAGFEADDLLGTLAKKAEAQGMEVALVSGDRDLLQIATDNIKIRIPKTKGGKTEVEDYYAKDVVEKFSLEPLQIIELKALMGDSSDNIPGVPKIGEKTATELLIRYHDIENLREHIPEISKKSIRETLENHFDMAVMSKKLATICITADTGIELEDAVLKNMYTPQAYELIKSLGFKQIAKRFEEGGAAGDVKTDKAEIKDIDKDELTGLLNGLSKKPSSNIITGFHIDTDGDGRISGMSLCTSDKEAYYCAFSEASGADEAVGSLVTCIKSSDPGAVFITYGLKKQLHLMNDAPDISYADRFKDIEIADYLINPLLKDYSFDQTPHTEAYAAYCNYEGRINKLKEAGMLELYNEIEMPLVFCLCEMEKWGMLVKPEALKEYGEGLDEQIKQLEDSIHEAAGDDFNINSPKQLGDILFEKMQIPGGKKNKSGYSTSADILEKLAPDYPFVADILKYRGLAKLKSTYVDGLYPCIGKDNRIHSTFHQTITATGRLSSSDPNLQNIPVRMEQGRLIRKIFVPEDGYIFVDADYSQIELRIMAHMSGDEKLIEAYNSEADIHRITASEVFHIPFEEVTDQQRRNAKAVNFGIIYGISSFGLSQDLSISVKEAKSFINRYFETYPKVKEFVDSLVKGAKDKGYVTTMFNRRRPVPELSSGNFMQRSFGERVAMNAPIQGTAADIMKIAMINVLKRLKSEGLRTRMILQVHDELLLEAPLDEKDKVCDLLVEEMEKAASLSVQLKAQLSTGTDWYHTK